MSTITPSPSYRFLPAVWKLIRLRLQISLNGFKHARIIRKILVIVAGFGLLAFAGMILFLSWLLLDFLRSPQLTQYVGMDVTPFLQAMPVFIFTALFLGILLSSFGVLLQALYLSGDMDFLLSSPVPIRAVFVTKLLQAVLPNFGLITLFGLPVLYGLGLAGHYNLLYYPLVLLTMIALALGLFFLAGISIVQKIPLAGFLYSLVAVAMCLAGMNGILLAFGALGANFKWEDPRKMSAGNLGCLGQFLTMLTLSLAFGLFIGPLWLVSAFNWPQVYGYLAGFILGVGVTGICAFLPPWLVRGKVERLGEA